MIVDYEMIPISQLVPGDIVELPNATVTVSRKDLKYDSFMGYTFRGDSYSLGKKLIKRFLLRK